MNIQFEEGDWILVSYGALDIQMYVNKLCGNYIRVSCKGWLATDGKWFHYDELNRRTKLKLGKGKKRWWWQFLPLRNLVCPYTDPL